MVRLFFENEAMKTLCGNHTMMKKTHKKTRIRAGRIKTRETYDGNEEFTNKENVLEVDFKFPSEIREQ
jgi:hypothetical protein